MSFCDKCGIQTDPHCHLCDKCSEELRHNQAVKTIARTAEELHQTIREKNYLIRLKDKKIKELEAQIKKLEEK